MAQGGRVVFTFSDAASVLGDGVSARFSSREQYQWDEEVEMSRARVESGIRAVLTSGECAGAGSTLVIGHGSLVAFSTKLVRLASDTSHCCS